MTMTKRTKTDAAIRAAEIHGVTVTHQRQAADLRAAYEAGEKTTSQFGIESDALNLLDDVIGYIHSDPISARELGQLRNQYIDEAR